MVSCFNLLNAQTTVTLGTSGAGSTDVTYPIYRSSTSSSYNFSVGYQVIPASVLTAAGIPSGNQISSIAWEKSDAATMSSGRDATLTIKMKNSSATNASLTADINTITSGMTTVYTSATVVPPASAGFWTINLQTPFVYTGGAIEIFVDWAINSGSGNPTTAAFRWSYSNNTGTNLGSLSGTDNYCIVQGAASALTGATVVGGNSPGITYNTAGRFHNTQLTHSTPSACSGSPTAGTTTGPSLACSGISFALGLSGSSLATGLTYQWQSSPASANTWSNIFGATSLSYNATQTAATDYRCVVTCTGSGQSSNSTPVSVGMNVAAPLCTTNISPSNGATNVSSTAISWNASVGAASYDVYFGTTNPPTANIGNTTGTSATITNLTAATTYYWYIVPKNATCAAAGCSTSTTSFTTASAPVNNECSGAIDLSAYIPYNGNNFFSTASGVAVGSCGGTAEDDVWYKFTALQNGTGTITFTPNPSSQFDAVLEAYSGTCGSLVLLDCEDNTLAAQAEVLTLNGLVAGQTYYLRVFDYYSTDRRATFSIALSGTALPVTLTNLKAERVGATNKLSWSTVTEQNNKGFELQRSNDGINFSGIDFISSKATNGNSNATLQYTYNDEKPFKGITYYRLKQLDFDGRNSISNVVFVKGSKVDNITISSIYPNPVVGLLKLVVTIPTTEKVSFVITDVTGKIVSQQNLQLNSGDNNVQLSVENLAKGTYIIKATCASGCESALSKFVKQ